MENIISLLNSSRRRGKYKSYPPANPIDDEIITPTYTPKYYVANNGSMSNDGLSPETPWNVANTLPILNMQPGDIVAFKCGDTFDQLISLAYSGTSGNPITIGAYGSGKRPILLSSQPRKTGWSLYSGNIWKYTFVGTEEVTQVFVDNVRMKLARNVKNGYSTITSKSSDTVFTASELNSGIDYTNAGCIMRVNEWNLAYTKVSSSSGNTLTVIQNNLYATAGRGFYLTNKLEFLTEPGEWVQEGKTLYLRLPDDTSPNGRNVWYCLSSDTPKLHFSDKSYITIRDLEITQANIGVEADGCDHIKIDNCRINNCEQIGVLFRFGDSHHNEITNTVIEDATQAGIKMWGSDCLFEDNRIKNIALFENLGLYGMGGETGGRGIDLNGANNVVRYNIIDNIGFLGIGMYQAQNNLIEYNYLTNCISVKDDGGVIYMWEGTEGTNHCAGTIIRKNIIVGAYGNREGLPYSSKFAAHGIYIDDRCEEITVEYNVISNVSNSNIFLHNNQTSIVRNNIGIGGVRSMLVNGALNTSSVTGNIFYAPATAPAPGGTWDNPQCVEDISSDAVYSNNKYIGHYHQANGLFRKQHEDYDFSGWVTQKGTDTGSTVDVSALPVGHSERMLYNETKVEKTFSLNGATVYDVDGNLLTEITLQPFTGEIVTGTGLELID